MATFHINQEELEILRNLKSKAFVNLKICRKNHNLLEMNYHLQEIGVMEWKVVLPRAAQRMNSSNKQAVLNIIILNSFTTLMTIC